MSALLTDQPNLYAGILDRYGIIAVSPQAKEDRGECEGIVYGFAPGGPGEAIVRVVGLGPQDATGDYHMDATTRAYTLVALAGVGAHVDITFELRHGRRWITDLTIRTPP